MKKETISFEVSQDLLASLKLGSAALAQSNSVSQIARVSWRMLGRRMLGRRMLGRRMLGRRMLGAQASRLPQAQSCGLRLDAGKMPALPAKTAEPGKNWMIRKAKSYMQNLMLMTRSPPERTWDFATFFFPFPKCALGNTASSASCAGKIFRAWQGNLRLRR